MKMRNYFIDKLELLINSVEQIELIKLFFENKLINNQLIYYQQRKTSFNDDFYQISFFLIE